ncbi:CysB family HTH-type transcriptional regulator [Crenothrix polyspora]|uniref:HTH-type transcriptional regulator CysB n=1 Tax=Crenothrix polyspora TaxID=360316 RepID=A0A1R4HFV3_9GAMM|nr:CysB family HTH-type transcriptional regulator [Crenothrix polyspora]SJM95126.1 HTH-type transcriptional regulator CysB [Crenothrix polyspora]
MKLIQLRYLCEIVRQNLSISRASEALHTSQSGVSRQIQLLEEALGVQVFQRHGKRLVCVTEPGKVIVELAERMLRELDSIKRVGEDFSQKNTGMLTIATTHTQARYFLPRAVKQFMRTYPDVVLTIHQGNPTQVAEQVVSGEADIGIATESINTYDKLLCLPCYQWNRCVVTPENHPLLTDLPLSLEKIAQYPLITYDFAFTGGSLVKRIFNQAGLEPKVVLTAIDADVIKTYVNLGLGIGLLAGMAYDAERDSGLRMVDVSHLFPVSTTYLGVRKEAFLRDYVYDFISLLVPKLSRKAIFTALKATKF